MKISIGSEIFDGPYGGGNSFLHNLKSELIKFGHEVVHDLTSDDIDIILMTNPLKSSELSTFNNYQIDFYQCFKNSKAISLHRINECDERKNTSYVNKAIITSNKNIDLNIFVSDWIKDLYEKLGISKSKSFVIKGGPDRKVFNSVKKQKWNKNEKLKIVTHHWSSNPNKGAAIYSMLDKLSINTELFEFTYIGNYPKDIKFQNTNCINPLSGVDLAKELSKHHIYITASKNEPSGNHHMEAALCGLPILFIDSGALPEYCSKYGVMFDESNIEEKIEEIIFNYDKYWENLKTYEWDFIHAFEEFKKLLNYIDENKHIIIKKRQKVMKTSVLINFIFNRFSVLLYNWFLSTKILLGRIKRILIK